ncbi:hypothetical protein QJS04_geneDACA018276 [Acorus gramineus]|uniref:Uncharacterized protein ycf33 n=1 Tax=Acorus gramineus TaxID=55184 RepID=A0AAV9BDA3_ACOGR|nr:hypothetical protein QJS04_geneDACA018276 [Acorus gramineus]
MFSPFMPHSHLITSTLKSTHLLLPLIKTATTTISRYKPNTPSSVTPKSPNTRIIKSHPPKPILLSATSTTRAQTRLVILGAASLGLAVLLLGGIDGQKALALGPEGPLMEEFWDNMRRYGLYVLTVSTGAIYTLLEPIVELLKNPITAILLITIFGGSFYIVSQVLNAMVGISEFNYDYGY